jgi:DNA-binding MarR family transcriptional regulator
VWVLINREQSLGRWISILYRYGQSYVSKKLECFNIGSGQYVILLTLFRTNGISQEKLSDYLKIDKGSIAKSIKKLEDEGYIRRSIDSDDKRAYKVSLTQKGLDIIPLVQEAIKSWEDIIISDLSDSEKQIIEQLLYRMAKKAYGDKTSDEENSR